MTSPDHFFKPLSNHKEEPSSQVWKGIASDQNAKRKKRGTLLWWGFSVTCVSIIAFWLLKDDFRSSQDPMSVNMVPVSNESASISTPKKMDAPTMNAASFSDNEETQSNYLNKSSTYTSSTSRNGIVKKDEPKYIIVKGHQPLQNEKLRQLDMAYNKYKENVQLPLKQSPIVPQDITIIPEESKLKEKTDSVPSDQLIVHKKKNRPQEKKPRKKFFEAQLMMAQTYRSLGHGSPDLETYRNLRNNSEIASTQAGIQLNAGLYINDHWSIQGGLMFMPQKLTSSYTWQQMKTTLVVDSTQTRTVFDSTTMQWVSKTDTFSHPVTTQQQMNNNSDQSFYYIKLPLIGQYEFAVRKLIYYAGLGASLNVLVASKGSIRDYNAGGGQMPVNSGLTRAIGMDLITRFGTRIPLGKSTELSMGLKGGYSPTSVFNKNYPLPQYHLWYGIEIGLRKLLF